MSTSKDEYRYRCDCGETFVMLKDAFRHQSANATFERKSGHTIRQVAGFEAARCTDCGMKFKKLDHAWEHHQKTSHSVEQVAHESISKALEESEEESKEDPE